MAEALTVEVEGVSKRFGATHALDRVSLALRERETHALVGRNGAGKSTLVSVLTGMVRPDGGEVRFAGRPAPKPDDREGWRRRVSCVYQRSTLVPHLSVAENLFVNAQPRGPLGLVSWKVLRRRAVKVLEEWQIDVDPGAEARRLHVEERQLVEIAAALESGARVLILDEPTARLERRAIRRLFEHVERLRQSGISILYISHHLDEIYEICQRATVLRDGRVVEEGVVEGLPKADLVAAMVGRDEESGHTTPREMGDRLARVEAVAEGPALLRVDRLTIAGWCAEISFSIRAGERVGLAGLAGSGKAQIAEAIAGLRQPAHGTVAVDGRTVPQGSVRKAIAHGVGFVPEDRHADGFVQSMSIEENVTLTRLDRLGRFGFISSRSRRRLASDLMRSLQVVASGPDQATSELSGGNQQKVVVGRALVTHPRLLVAVSPTAGVDIASKEALFDALEPTQDMAVLVVSDEVDELSECDRVLVIFDGRLRQELTTWREWELVAAMEGVEDQ